MREQKRNLTQIVSHILWRHWSDEIFPNGSTHFIYFNNWGAFEIDLRRYSDCLLRINPINIIKQMVFAYVLE